MKPMGFLVDTQQLETVKKSILKEVENHFSPEFLNRIDDIIVFSPLTREEVKEICRRYLERIRQNLAAQGKTFVITEEGLELLVEIGFSLKYGARFLKRRIDERVKIPITQHWKEGQEFDVEATGGELTVTWKP
jgi:ATP-dependent Clp protease ATP-binding subunit ClpA